MGTLSTTTINMRKAHALEVLRLMTVEHMTQEEACLQVGIAPDTFRRYRDLDPEGLSMFQDLMVETTRQSLALVLGNRTVVLSKLIADAVDDDTKPADRATLFKALESHLRELTEEARLNSGDAGAAEDVLGGPVLAPAQSRFSIAQDGDKTTITINAPQPIIEYSPGSLAKSDREHPELNPGESHPDSA